MRVMNRYLVLLISLMLSVGSVAGEEGLENVGKGEISEDKLVLSPDQIYFNIQRLKEAILSGDFVPGEEPKSDYAIMVYEVVERIVLSIEDMSEEEYKRLVEKCMRANLLDDEMKSKEASDSTLESRRDFWESLYSNIILKRDKLSRSQKGAAVLLALQLALKNKK
ncbi:MAG: hypothetical protein AB8E15_00570 [Bdellovibrionales bacterium]